MEKHLIYLLIYFKSKTTLFYVSKNKKKKKNNFLKNNYFPRQIKLVKRKTTVCHFCRFFKMSN